MTPLLVLSGRNMSHVYAPLAVVTVKSGRPAIETRIVLFAGKPTIAKRARLPAGTVAGDTINPGVLGAACSLAAVSPGDHVMLPPSKFCW